MQRSYPTLLLHTIVIVMLGMCLMVEKILDK